MTGIQYRLMVISVLVISSVLLHAQLPDYHAQLFDESDGILTDLQRVVKDKSGFVWIMYADRVQRFDGKFMQEFFMSDGLVSMHCDHQNRLWLTKGSEIFLFDPWQQTFLSSPIDKTQKRALGMLFEVDARMYVAATDGFQTFNENVEKWEPVSIDMIDTSETITIRKYTISYDQHKLFYYRADSVRSYDLVTHERNAMPAERPYGIYALDQNQIVYVNWTGQSFLYDFQLRTIRRILPRIPAVEDPNAFLTINDVLKLDPQRYLISSAQGFLQLNLANVSLTPVRLYWKGQPLQLEGGLTDLYLDDQRNVWICGENSLITFKPFEETIGLIRHVGTEPFRKTNNQVRNFAADDDGNFWLARQNGIAHWDITRNTFQSIVAVEGAIDKMNHPSIRGIAWDGKYVIIGQTNRGIWLYNPLTKTYRRPIYLPGEIGDSTRQRLEHDFIDQFYTLHDGRIIIPCRDGSYVMHPESYVVSLIDFPGKSENNNFAYEDAQRNIWIGTANGIHCLDSNLVPTFSVYDTIVKGLPRSMYQLDTHTYLLGSLGLYQITITPDAHRVEVMHPYFERINIATIHKDTLDRLWFAADEGLFCYDVANNYIERFDQVDNVQGYVFYQNCIVSDANGRVFMGGTNGINYFYPDRMEIGRDTLQVSLMNVTVNEEDTTIHDMSKPLALRASQNALTFVYIAPYFGDPRKTQYRYKLAGLQESWTMTGSDNTARFSSLAPGKYQFTVAASVNGVDWFECENPLTFSIAYPFWRTWWFISLCILILGTAVFYLFRRRVRVIQDREEVRRNYEKRIAEVEMYALRAQMNPHFMFNSLNSINNFILKNDPDNASGYLTKFSRLMRLILDNSRSEWVVLESELKALELYIELEVVRFDNVFSYEISVAPDIDTSTIWVPPMMIQPYVENAIWHGLLHRNTLGGMLQIAIRRKGEELLIVVEDNGVGRAEAARLNSKSATKHKSHGMKITAERIEIVNRIYHINAQVAVEDVAGHNGYVGGTRVSLTLKDKSYEGNHRG